MNERVQALINELALIEHQEGGYFAETYRDAIGMSTDRAGERRAIMTSIYYMLTADRPIGYFHKNMSDIVHYFHEGDGLTYLLINPKGQLERHVLGNQPGQQRQLVVPGGYWKATVLEQGDYGLLGEAVAPGFEYQDMAFAKPEQMQADYPDLWPQLQSYVK